MRRPVLAWLPLLLGLLILVPGARAAEPKVADESILAWFPAGAVAVVEINGLGGQLGRLRKSGLPEWLARQQPGEGGLQQFEQVRRGAETVLGERPFEKLEALLADRWAVAVYPADAARPGRPRGAAVARVKDAVALRGVLTRLGAALLAVEDLTKPRQKRDGFNVLTLKDGGRLAFGETVVIAATDDRMLNQLLPRAAGRPAKGPTLADGKLLRQARRTCGPRGPMIGLYIDPPKVAAIYQQPLNVPTRTDNAVASLLFGDLLVVAADSPFVALTVSVNEKSLDISLWSRQKTQNDSLVEGAFPTSVKVTAPRQLARGTALQLTIRRDWTAWYKRREHLMEESVLPEFDKFESAIGNLLPGRDFAEDILPVFGSEMSLVVTTPPNKVSTDGTLALPGMAFVMELNDPRKGGDLMRLLFQNIVAILNFQAGEQGTQPWILESQSYRDVDIFYGRPLPSEASAGNAVLAGLRPAAATVGNRYFICSSLDVCRRLIDQHTAARSAVRLVPAGTSIEVDFQAVAESLRQNEKPVVAGAVRNGRTLIEAKRFLAEGLEWLGRLDKVSSGTEIQDGTARWRMTWSWK